MWVSQFDLPNSIFSREWLPVGPDARLKPLLQVVIHQRLNILARR